MADTCPLSNAMELITLSQWLAVVGEAMSGDNLRFEMSQLGGSMSCYCHLLLMPTARGIYYDAHFIYGGKKAKRLYIT